MRTLRLTRLAGAAVATWLGLAAPAAEAAHRQDPGRHRAAAKAAPSSDPIDAALSKRIRGEARLDDVRIEANWRRKTGIVTARVYGNGIGIWNDARQFRLSRDEVLAMLGALEKARFGAMPPHYGSVEEGEGAEAEKEEKEKKKEKKEKAYLYGAIGLRVGSEVKRVAQYMKGEQSEAFRRLCEKILAVSEGAAKSGIGATSMGDGLGNLASEKLAPETLQVLVHRTSDRPGPGAEDGSWILRMDGRRVTDRAVERGKTPAALRLLILSETDFRALAAVLAENAPGDLPRNLYSPQYLTVDVRLLKEHSDISARRYAGTTAETHGAKQAAFDRIYAAFLALHQRVEKEGAVLPATAE